MDEAIQEIDALKGRAMKFEKNFNKCSKANRTKGYLEGRMMGLDELWKSICEADDKIESLKTKENKNNSYFEDDQFALLEEKYYELKGQIKDQLRVFEPKKEQRNTSQNSGPNVHQEMSKVKLPKIPLPTFAGSYHTWISFKNRFTNAIHNNKSLSDVEKMEYLASCVTHKAERAISRFQITDQNYKAAWDRLNEKYENKRILQDTQIESILDLKEVKVETAKEIREVMDVIEEALESLKHLEVDTKSWGPILMVILKRKLPFKTREEWEKQLEPEDVPTYEQLMKFLERRYRTVENLELVGGTSSEAESKITSNTRIEMNQRAKCTACNDNFHSLMKCESFLSMSVSNRSAFVNAKGLCRNCLASGHMIKDCQSVKKCYKCNRTHHTLLHRDDFDKSVSQEPIYSRSNFLTRGQSSQSVNSNYNQNLNSNRNPNFNQNGQSSFNQTGSSSNRNPFNTSISHNGAYTRIPNEQRNQQAEQNTLSSSAQNFQPNQSSQNQGSQQDRQNFTTITADSETLFPTAIIRFRSRGGTTYNLRALLDQCSEDVFIKESVAKMLGGVQFGISSFDVTGLQGAVTSRVEKSTSIQMVIENEVFDMEANIVPTLVGILPKTIVKWPRELFKNVKLADPNFATPNNVDIMLGTRAYTQILLEGVLKEGGYLAQNTKVGWIVSGKSEEGSTVSNSKRMFLCMHARNEESYRRLCDDRPRVKLPFKENPSEKLVESRNQRNRNFNDIPDKKKYYAPQRNLRQEYFISGLPNMQIVVSPRLSLINVKVNRPRNLSKNSNFEQRWISSSRFSNENQ